MIESGLMPASERELRIPDRFIPRRVLTEPGGYLEGYRTFGNFMVLLQDVQRLRIILPGPNQPVFHYIPRLPGTSLGFNPLLPSLETTYMLPAGIIAGEIGAGGEEDDERKRLRKQIILGLTNLLTIIDLAYRNRINWNAPEISRDHQAHFLVRAQKGLRKELQSVSYSPGLDRLQIKWYQFHPRYIREQEFRPHSLIAEVQFCLARPDANTGLLVNRFYVSEVPWELDVDKKPKLGKGRDILEEYLAPQDPHVRLMSGDLTQGIFLNRRLVEVLNLGFLLR